MIKKIIKNRREIAKAALMVSIVYGIIIVNAIRGPGYEKN